MLKWTFVFLIFSVMAGVAGVFGLAATSAGFLLGMADFEEPVNGYFELV